MLLILRVYFPIPLPVCKIVLSLCHYENICNRRLQDGLAGVIAEAVVKGLLPEYDLIGVYSRTAAKAERIAGQMRNAGVPVLCASLWKSCWR